MPNARRNAESVIRTGVAAWILAILLSLLSIVPSLFGAWVAAASNAPQLAVGILIAGPFLGISIGALTGLFFGATLGRGFAWILAATVGWVSGIGVFTGGADEISHSHWIVAFGLILFGQIVGIGLNAADARFWRPRFAVVPAGHGLYHRSRDHRGVGCPPDRPVDGGPGVNRRAGGPRRTRVDYDARRNARRTEWCRVAAATVRAAGKARTCVAIPVTLVVKEIVLRTIWDMGNRLFPLDDPPILLPWHREWHNCCRYRGRPACPMTVAGAPLPMVGSVVASPLPSSLAENVGQEQRGRMPNVGCEYKSDYLASEQMLAAVRAISTVLAEIFGDCTFTAYYGSGARLHASLLYVPMAVQTSVLPYFLEDSIDQRRPERGQDGQD